MQGLGNGFVGPNEAYLEELFERYQRDPGAVDESTRRYFEREFPLGRALAGDSEGALAVRKLSAAVNFAQALREFGHLGARLDPLGSEPPGDPTLELAHWDLEEDDLAGIPASAILGGDAGAGTHTALDAVRFLRDRYLGTQGYDIHQVRDPREREWLREAVETGRFRPPTLPIDDEALLHRLVEVECFEKFLHRIFPGKTRFSIEGLDVLVPVLDEVILSAAEAGISNTLLGMAHRGRLNVLAHVLQKPYCEILLEFKDPLHSRYFHEYDAYTGDVKYHMGARREIGGMNLKVTLAPNPSHLEFVHPVVEGMARAAGTHASDPGEPRFDPDLTLPLVIHGDAAFPGQGVVAETLNLSRLPAYTTGGTIHIVANNRLGYTTTPDDLHGTLHGSDLAKGFKVPVLHVNADDVKACIEAARLAFAYRQEFHKDFLIDLVGYRRHGHNEGDEPSFTQPLLYEKIRNHDTVTRLFAEQMGRVSDAAADLDELMHRQMEQLERELELLEQKDHCELQPPEIPEDVRVESVDTAVGEDRLRDLHETLLEVPDSFHLHPKIERSLERRRKTFDDFDEPTVDWARAEMLALATILEDGIPIRFTGEDVERGTFSQRHAVYHDVETGGTHIPLQTFRRAAASFEIRNSPLTESATIGFEFGYNVQESGRLVIWEAQYGDFINVAQVMLDEFVLSARAKWSQTPSLVLLLPHGYEGQGPDHCTGRIERFLGLAAEDNLRVANCTTAAQYFHLLRAHATLLEKDPKPLVIFTPKSLLRNPNVASSPRDLAEGSFRSTIPDARAGEHPGEVRRLLFCSGKIYVDLDSSKARGSSKGVAIHRIEELFPLPCKEIEAAIDTYPDLDEVVWVQEEPANMGPWDFMRPRLKEILDGRLPLRYLGRPRRSSPAEGSAAWHQSNQKTLVEYAFDRRRKLCEVDTAQSRGKRMK